MMRRGYGVPSVEAMTQDRRTPTVDVVVVDDQPVFRQVAREVVDATPGFEMVGEASSGEHTLDVVEALQPDLVFVDVRMPGIDGIETAALLHRAHPGVVVVLISLEEPAHLPDDAASCGAAELLRKQDFGPPTLRRVWERYGR
jgi:two-component system invasion response regulator UvrY